MKLKWILFLCISMIIATSGMVRAEDEIDGEDDMSVSEDQVLSDSDGEETNTDDLSESDADTYLLFTKPVFEDKASIELPAGRLSEFLIGFINKGSQEIVLETLDASLRYPMDFNFHIQNFSTIILDKAIPPGSEATIGYAFIPADAFAGRPFGLVINLAYRDYDGKQTINKLYNDTINIVEVEEGLDGETLFLYLLMAAACVLLLVGGQQLLYSVGKKRSGSLPSRARANVETGTKSTKQVDMDWVPKNVINHLNKQKALSPKQKRVKKTE
ncbi:translocon-associated protein subunit alpha [Daktulosphaira vitifoliae]|uniref:translocon-associated protein subunit alpha n=1 Tax=Daktulosphaira vitifoliae TaxID=58002 RepID=UPI0021AA98AB|nr:translocon-associated protein subunit alpha [Daktulosphaira vitifoliae]